TSFTTVKHGADSATYVNGINNSGTTVGGTGTIYTTKGFALQGSRFQFLNVPGDFVYVYGTGVNNVGTIVGWTEYDGFLCRRGRCQIFDYPGASTTEALGVNDAVVIVGWYNPSSSFSYAFVKKNGKYFSFSYPGATFTDASGINNLGQIVGAYTSDFRAWHGF